MATSASSYFQGGASAITVFPTAGASGHLQDHADIYQALLGHENTFTSGSAFAAAMTSGTTGTGSVTLNTSPNFLGTPTINGVAIAPVTIQNQGSNITTSAGSINFTGAGVTAAATGGSVTVTIPGGGGGSSSVAIQNSGVVVTSAASVLNFTGTGIASITNSGGSVTITTGSSTSTFTNSTLNNPTIASATFAAGGSTRAPIIMSAGSLSTTASAGSLEYDGNAFYLTTNTSASSRGIVPTTLFYSPSAQVILPNNGGTLATASAALFGVGLTVLGNTTYEMELVFDIGTTGSTNHSMDMYFLGTASVASIGYIAMTQSNASTLGNGPGAGSFIWGKQANPGVTLFNPAGNTTGLFNPTFIKGSVRFASSGTFIPTILNSASPGATSSVALGSYIKMVPYGTSSVQFIGPWA